MSSITPAYNGSATGDQKSHHHHHHHTGRRIRQFLRPNGQKVHIASSPEEIEGLRRALTNTESGEFDIVIHGSPEHIEALRETHTHHEQAREQLRSKYGDDFHEFERIIRQVDELASELHMISDHAVQLDANFSKFGYNAHLRTRDSPNGSSANSLRDDSGESGHTDWEAERKRGVTMKFWQTPVIRQYFHKGLLWRSAEQQEVASYELFVDLFYVGIIAISGDRASELATAEGLHSFAITFILAYRFWTDISMLIAWFDTDDIVRRINILFSLACLLGMTTNFNEAFGETYTPLIAFYLAARFLRAVHFLWMAYVIPMVRPFMIGNSIIYVLPGAVWIGSIYVERPQQFALIWIAITLDLFGYFSLLMLQRKGSKVPGRIGEWCKSLFDFYPATNIEHKIDRTGAFVTLVFGYSVVALLYQNHVEFGINAFFGKAVLGLVQAFAFNWIYFEMDHFNLYSHAIRRHVVSSFVWISVHLPFTMGFVLAGASLAKLVLAHDCPDADPHDLWEVYYERSEEEINEGLRWFYCAGLGVALACMGIISMTHIHKEIPNERISKRYRLVYRGIISLILILLPLAGHSLNSLELVATTTCLTISVLLVELAGATCSGDKFWLQRGRKCNYSARCKMSKKDFEAKLKDGTVLNVEEIAKGEKDDQGGMHY